MPEDRDAEREDVDGPLEWSLAFGMVAAQARLCVLLCKKPLRPFPGSAHLTHLTRDGCKTNNTTGCNESKTFRSVARKNSSELATLDMLDKNTPWVLGTKCWYSLVYKRSPSLTLKLGDRTKPAENRCHLLRRSFGRRSSRVANQRRSPIGFCYHSSPRKYHTQSRSETPPVC